MSVLVKNAPDSPDETVPTRGTREAGGYRILKYGFSDGSFVTSVAAVMPRILTGQSRPGLSDSQCEL
jgi:hypothetical protein